MKEDQARIPKPAKSTFLNDQCNIKWSKGNRKLERDKEALEAEWIPKWTQESKVKIGSSLAGLVIEYESRSNMFSIYKQ